MDYRIRAADLFSGASGRLRLRLVHAAGWATDRATASGVAWRSRVVQLSGRDRSHRPGDAGGDESRARPSSAQPALRTASSASKSRKKSSRKGPENRMFALAANRRVERGLRTKPAATLALLSW